MNFKDAADTLRRQGHKTFTVTGDKGFRITIDDAFVYSPEQLVFLVQNNLRPGTHIWSRVVLNSDVPDWQATGLMDSVQKAYQAEGVPEGVEIFHAPATGGFVYYFSPQAADMIPPNIERTPCVKPDTTNMRKVQL